LIFLLLLQCGVSLAQTDSVMRTQTPVQQSSSTFPINSLAERVPNVALQRFKLVFAFRDSIKNVWQLPSATKAFKSYGNIPLAPKVKDEMPQPLHATGLPEWLFWVLLAQLALIVFVRVQFTREFAEVFTVFINSNLTQQLYRETQAAGLRMGYTLLNLNFVVSLGVWVYLAMKQNGLTAHYPDAYVLPTVVIGVGILLAARFTALRLASWLLKSSREIGLFGFTDLQLFRATGLLLFVVNAFVSYAQAPYRVYFFMFSLIVLVTFLLFRFLRGFEIGKNYLGQNFFHFLVYLCALEIAPVLIGIRFFLNRFGL